MVQIRLSKLVSAPFSASLQKLITSTKIPVKTAFRLRKLAKQVIEEQQNHDELRKGIAFKYAMKNENGEPIIEENQVRIAQENFPIVDRELNELNGILIDVEQFVFERDMPEMALTVEDLLALEFVVSEDDLASE